MHEKPINQNVMEALEKVEHPAIATTLLDLGMLREVVVSPKGQTNLTLVLPFPSIPENVRNYMVNSLSAAVGSAGGELVKANVALMNEVERQDFLAKEQQNWRG
ncbi:MAG: iron-sulfur cluster assembly protein [Chloroflexota bacterium]|nr:iron-sulfur cluster assembly protein [Chloroflexota bacterium]